MFANSYIHLFVYLKDGRSLKGGYNNDFGSVRCAMGFEGSTEWFYENLEDGKNLVKAARKWYANGLDNPREMKDSEYGYGDLKEIKQVKVDEISSISVLWGFDDGEDRFEYEARYSYPDKKFKFPGYKFH